MNWILIALGGGIGASLRYGVQLFFLKKNMPFYSATIVVNLIGSFLLGVASNWLLTGDDLLIAFVTTGFLGGFTTFSTFAYDLVKLLQTKSLIKVVLYSSSNLIGGIIAFGFGWIM